MQKKLQELAATFETMVANAQSPTESWRNIALARRAFELMKQLPDTLAGEYESPAEKAGLLAQMLEQTDETLTPRFSLSVREYMAALNPADDDNRSEMTRLRDFIDPQLPMEEYCKRYGRMLRFDPVERTAEWEAVVEAVEEEVSRELEGEPWHMGYCYRYWSAKRDALARRGIEWRSPSAMNPGVMFD